MSLARQRKPHYGRTGKAGFDFTLHMRRLCEDVTARLDQLRHIDMSRVAIGFSQARKATSHGMYASLTPMRFAGGRRHVVRGGKKWGVQRLHGSSGREMLYILTFYLPRFFELGFREKLATVFHELWHIGPAFDGDMRRFGGRCSVHGHSQQRYDAQAEKLVDGWLALEPPESVCGVLRLNFQELLARHGHVFGRKIPVPKLFAME